MEGIFGSLFEGFVCIVLIFGPIIGYIPQYQEINRTQDSSGFSTLVCFILISANILRVFFWILKHFETTLLFQSLVMIAAQLLLLELIIRVNLRRKPHMDESRNYQINRGFNMNRFWAWDYFGEYLAFLAAFVLTIGVLTILNKSLLHSSWLTEGIGFFALMTEATLALPQLWQNYVSKSCRGLSTELVLTWFIGDAFKTAFFLWRTSPIQFIICGIIQLIADIGIGIQMHMYSGSSSGKQMPFSGGPAHLHDVGVLGAGGEVEGIEGLEGVEVEEFVLLRELSAKAGIFGDPTPPNREEEYISLTRPSPTKQRDNVVFIK